MLVVQEILVIMGQAEQAAQEDFQEIQVAQVIREVVQME
jgi:hypothetical protein